MARYKRSLQAWKRELALLDWARTLFNMGGACTSRVHGSKEDNMEEAVVCYKLALHVGTREVAPQDWATTQHSRGNALVDRVHGCMLENIEEAVVCYKRAHGIRFWDVATLDWATTQKNLGSAYTNRVRGSKFENMDETVDCFKRALKVTRRNVAPLEWATTQTIWATHAVTACAGVRRKTWRRPWRATSERARSGLGRWHRRTPCNMGGANTSRVHSSKADNVEQAVVC